MSTGPRSPEGLARSRRANWKHGRYSAEARTKRRRERAALQRAHAMLAILEGKAPKTADTEHLTPTDLAVLLGVV